MRFLDRVILFAGAVMTACVGLALFIAGLQVQGAARESMPVMLRISRILFGLLLIAFGAYVAYFPRHNAIQRKDFVVQRTDSGELRISVKAIENLVKKCVDLHKEIKLLSSTILNAREGVVVELNISLANNISIPLAVASLQKQIKQYLVASCGVEVKEVRVSVESTRDEPLLVMEAEEEDAAQEKKPLHQRLFGQPEQPAIVPEPPKPAEGDLAPVTGAPDFPLSPAGKKPEDLRFTYAGADAPVGGMEPVMPRRADKEENPG